MSEGCHEGGAVRSRSRPDSDAEAVAEDARQDAGDAADRRPPDGDRDRDRDDDADGDGDGDADRDGDEDAAEERDCEPAGPSPEESPTKLIVNYIPEVMNQNTMCSLFATMGKLESCKLIANRGYGFVEYCSPEDAARARKAFDGLPMQNKTLKVSYALLRPECKPAAGPGAKAEADWNLYVCNLPEECSLHALHQLFQQFGRILNSRVAAGIAFILYQHQAEAERAIRHMNGAVPEGYPSPLTVKYANKTNPGKKSGGRAGGHQYQYQQQHSQPHGHGHAHQHHAHLVKGYGPSWYAGVLHGHEHGAMSASASASASGSGAGSGGWSIYIYNIAGDVEELTLWQLFGPYGAIVSVRIIKDHQSNRSKGFGFVTMRNYEQAAVAIQALNGYVLCGQALSVSFKTQKR